MKIHKEKNSEAEESVAIKGGRWKLKCDMRAPTQKVLLGQGHDLRICKSWPSLYDGYVAWVWWLGWED